jgi:HTH-type transcriptional regulator/antitoxin HigA
MEIKPIRTEEEYRLALKEIDDLFFAEPDTPEGNRLEILVMLVEKYEAKYHPIPKPDPIDAIEFNMERLGITRRDLEPFIGSRARVSEVLNRKRPLTKRMIWKINEGLGIPLDILAQKYGLNVTKEEEAQLSATENLFEEISDQYLDVNFSTVNGDTQIFSGSGSENIFHQVARQYYRELEDFIRTNEPIVNKVASQVNLVDHKVFIGEKEPHEVGEKSYVL